jgi:aminopeptidase YwaD
VRNAQSAGATGVIIYNNDAGVFLGSLSEQATIPVLGISQDEGKNLVASLAGGNVQVALSVAAEQSTISRNVIAKPRGKDCEIIAGGHYDGVSVSPAANDNGSGSATVLELANVMASRSEASNICFILFGAEEVGLVGSKYYVNSLDAAARGKLKAMLNFDMVGVGDIGWLFIGTNSLQERAVALAQQAGMTDAQSGVLPRNSSSDGESFIRAGIPALFIYRTEDTQWHQPGDKLERLNPAYLEQAARLGLLLLEQLNGG